MALTDPLSQFKPTTDSISLSTQGENSQSILRMPYQVQNLDELLQQTQDFIHYKFNQKVFEVAQKFLTIKFSKLGHKAQFDINAIGLEDYKRLLHSSDHVYSGMSLDISFSKVQRLLGKLPSEETMKRFVSDLNAEFNLERRLGLFLLEKTNIGYELMFNPTDEVDSMNKFISDPRDLTKSLARTDYHPNNVLTKDELFTLQMEYSFVEVFQDLFPESFGIAVRDSDNSLVVFFNDRTGVIELDAEVKSWNSEHNVNNRVGLFRYEIIGPKKAVIYFQPSLNNKSYLNYRDEILTQKVIAHLEETFNVVYDPQKS
jgi:hypothetical protein